MRLKAIKLNRDRWPGGCGIRFFSPLARCYYRFTDTGGGPLVDFSVPTEPSLLNPGGGHSTQIVDYKQMSVSFSTNFPGGALPKSTARIFQRECLWVGDCASRKCHLGVTRRGLTEPVVGNWNYNCSTCKLSWNKWRLEHRGEGVGMQPAKFCITVGSPCFHKQTCADLASAYPNPSQSAHVRSAPIPQSIPQMIPRTLSTFVPQQMPHHHQQLLHMGIPYQYVQRALVVPAIRPKSSVWFDGNPPKLPYFLIQVDTYMHDFDQYYRNDGERVRDMATTFKGDATEWCSGLSTSEFLVPLSDKSMFWSLALPEEELELDNHLSEMLELQLSYSKVLG
uniref:Uncharacterized protein n=1 Tax=Sphaerodactylus townsendi TaxID=933632 RepID=A0ACB8EUG6_9SAUR